MRVVYPLLLVLVLAACGGTPSGAPSATTEASGVAEPSETAPPTGTMVFVPGIADGPGTSVSEAIARAPLDLSLVNGTLLFQADGMVWLCESLLESSPPQCGGARLQVENYPPVLPDNVQEADGARWLDDMQVLGDVRRP